MPCCQVNPVVVNPRRSIPSRHQPVCNLCCLLKEHFASRKIICTQKPAYNSEGQKTKRNPDYLDPNEFLLAAELC